MVLIERLGSISQRIGSISGWSGFGGSEPSSPSENEAMRALPANWYNTEPMYELERRAIFSREWLLITHNSRLQEPGDFLKFTVAGFQLIINKDRKGDINGFHNVCRHRAFPVINEDYKDAGNVKIFSCKYHGWSYGLNGNLAKAPGYQELPGFDKTKNSLMKIHVHVDYNGFIYVNLDGKETPDVPWEHRFKDIDTQERYKEFFVPEDYVFDHEYQMDEDVNWKILSDNYNECYHCATTHPDIGELANLESYSVDTKDGNIIHNPATTDKQREAGLTVASTYYFPNVSTNITPHFFMIQRFVPSSSKKSSMQYQIFRNKNATDEQFDLVSQIYKRIMSEDKELCRQAQKNLNNGIFVNGELHPKLEKGPLYFQKSIRETVMAHDKREKAAKKEIRPAARQDSLMGSQADIDFCSGLACETTPRELEW